MKTIYTIPCQDGTDPNCRGTVDVKIPMKDLSTEEVLELVQRGRVDLEGEKEFVFRVQGTICDACGSDAERPKDEWN